MSDQGYANRLETRIQASGNPICFGMDPVLDLMPVEGTPEEKIRRFYLEILGEFVKRGITPAAIKPNSAYYECVSIQAMHVLQELIREYSREGIVVVLDAKRGDIGKSSAAYAKAAFSIYGADAVTVSPWMGADSVEPFLKVGPNYGVYALLRTSNKGARDFQDLPVRDAGPVFESVATKCIEWDNGSLGAVVGATSPAELEAITRFFVQRKHEIPFLIPGVSIPGVPGQQGGLASEVISAIRSGGGIRKFHLLNSSSGLSFAWQAGGNPKAYASACVDAFERLSDDIRKAVG
jgi:orotidine-5'-phosphate decarboxylase